MAVHPQIHHVIGLFVVLAAMMAQPIVVEVVEQGGGLIVQRSEPAARLVVAFELVQ